MVKHGHFEFIALENIEAKNKFLFYLEKILIPNQS